MNFAIFDMDGLLFDTEKLYLEAVKIINHEMGDEFSLKAFKDSIGTTRKTQEIIMKNLYGNDYNFELFDIKLHEKMEEFLKQGRLEIKPGVFEILDYLKSKNFRIALATSTHKEKAYKLLKENNLFDRFEYIATGDMVENGKPAPDIFLLAGSKIDAIPSKTLVFEDSFNGIIGANKGGFNAVMVPDILEPTEEIKKITYKILGSLNDYLELNL